ncbi:hypothetical protein [Polymorphum gilvum]|uniref:Uncharacterized protein n=1 Tax=Polymorphum gilvum (strain LMG 25793 / CGMCC 1.9160 / SL003B-26A1) TaxID=991905 RepID=F2J5K9_POLGS|nr:hypothetical protein [Polymorphum gilvum]ADZ70093.1 hypothetical protein SL003B_1665 [Polymorphum gilvum SL003B-26A1]
MLSDDITNLCRNLFVKSAELGRDDPMHGYLMKVAGRLQALRDQAFELERARIAPQFRGPVLIDLSNDKVIPLARFKRPVRPQAGDGGGAA